MPPIHIQYVRWAENAAKGDFGISFQYKQDVMNVRGANGSESTLSFMGMGLPLQIISWGSMLSLSEKALLTDSWWIMIIPGAFLVTLLMCLTNIGNYLRKAANRKESNL